ncbi:beta-ketoacyl-[acyl-carrier-protein] synthase family protein [Dactylosporangium aurantiacum]|uniref:Beta-ketoacyl-[acyl-carrier-protein] synthase family protein n=1 Tax=Dactylosporangium aurantiacum TaxID=35754 RepID=A0A9Q9IN47_9ACTN|nr:beta-ketoacyl-[acyl-carrier-protein] synthase family protein [Dactylosporangium aurantiacum]MDG6105683.1 beta-ketoacyl-[acyl-carrier-protein] synthase family protein [Dactylosporangium aurantiacum]UWZ56990.1 beta-ketoacyl-[acyl-carrier-protein] synthase family protein [Dactylosporangium aurantiacum]
MTRSVAITGIGLVTPVGSTGAEVFDAMCDGRSGLVRPGADHPLAGSVDVAAFAPAIDPTSVLPAPETRVVDRYIVMAMAAAEQALADAGIEVGRDVDPYRIAIILSGTGGLATLDAQAVLRSQKGRLGVSPYLLPGMLPNMGAARVAMRHGIQGYSSSIGTACAAGAQSIGEAVRLLRAGEADVVVAGCSEAPLFPTLADTFGNARALARGWDDPTAASRPFDRRRNGLVLGEGAGVFVVERAEHAEARRARRYADLVGWGATNDAHHPTTPRPDGSAAAACMSRAIADAGIEPGDVGYVNAHGTSTKLGDVAESTAIRAVFGAGAPPVSSTKGVTGHMLGASGVVEAAVSVHAMLRGLLPPTHNLDEPDPACDLDHLREPRPAEVTHVLSNSFGFGGHNVSLIFGRPESSWTRTA